MKHSVMTADVLDGLKATLVAAGLVITISVIGFMFAFVIQI